MSGVPRILKRLLVVAAILTVAVAALAVYLVLSLIHI